MPSATIYLRSQTFLDSRYGRPIHLTGELPGQLVEAWACIPPYGKRGDAASTQDSPMEVSEMCQAFPAIPETLFFSLISGQMWALHPNTLNQSSLSVILAIIFSPGKIH
jgi:hypothetical protein